MEGEYGKLALMDEGRKRVLLIAASILAARSLAQWDGRPSPAIDTAIEGPRNNRLKTSSNKQRGMTYGTVGFFYFNAARRCLMLRRSFVLALLLVCGLSSPLFAGKKNWQDAKVVDITSVDTGIRLAVPVGTTVVRGPIYQTNYTIETDSLLITLAKRGKPVNVTLHGATKIALDGDHAYLLDDSGKTVKLPVVGKVAK